MQESCGCIVLQGEYEQLAMQCQNFAVELLDQTRSSRELEVILNHDSESVAAVADAQQTPITTRMTADDIKHMRLSRLKLAIKCKQKRVRKHLTTSPLVYFDSFPFVRLISTLTLPL